jgi:hypothetical protein
VDVLLPLLLVGAIAYIVWRILPRASRKPAPRTAANRSRAVAPAAGQEHHWEGRGDFEFEVVGESHYQATLAALAGPHRAESAEKPCRAVLVLEDTNAHDPKAVCVQIEGKKVGYLARKDARSYRRRLGACAAEAQRCSDRRQ